MQKLEANGDLLIGRSATLADALAHDAPERSGEAHWNEEAKALIVGLILHTVVHEPTDRRIRARVRDKLTLGSAGFAALGSLEPVECAMVLMAVYGLQFWPILKDMHQLKATYGVRS